MKRKAPKPKWTLKVVELAESPFSGESKRKRTKFQADLYRDGNINGFFWGTTRESVIKQAEARKVQYEAGQRTRENAEVIEL